MSEVKQENEKIQEKDSIQDAKETLAKIQEAIKEAKELKIKDVLSGKSDSGQEPVKENPEDKIEKECNEALKDTGLTI
ncbi:MAG: hypothetical protein CMI54_00730 [Parcubacteria group bacterium]|jgi:hypothetical protein|nr:hypothetical protein [Parcubacteria group bacterium]|tara:strand:+ start:714 stop:947 length:234 start_codon:yes stop_codon:yes gene_type:complete